MIHEVCPEAKDAIARAVQQESPISDLEALGLNSRSISQLNDAGIITMGELMSKSPEQLLLLVRSGKKKYSFGEGSLKQLFNALARYHELEQDSKINRCISAIRGKTDI